MTVFKNYLKIIKQFLPMIVIYIVIFTTFAVFASKQNAVNTDFDNKKPNIALFVEDENTTLVKTIKEYLSDSTNIIKMNKDEVKDALYYRKIVYSLTIPKNFTKNFMNNVESKIETLKVPGDYETVYVEMTLKRIMTTFKTYIASGMSEEEIQTSISKDLKVKTNVEVVNYGTDTKIGQVRYFYNFSNYTILGISMAIVGMVMNIFTNENIKKRNMVSGSSITTINKQLFLGNIILVTSVWLTYVFISIALYQSAMFTLHGLLFFINSLIFSIVALSIGFMIGILVKNKELMNGLFNVIALGSSFLAGAFVPQELLGDFVINISKLLPSYYFINNNNQIALLSNFDNINGIIINMIIMILFVIGFFVLTNILVKKKSN